MPTLKELIDLHCPDGVEYVQFGELITHLRTGLNPRKNFSLNTEDASNHYVTVRELNGYSVSPDEKTDKVNDAAIELINKRSQLQIGDILFSGVGTVGKTALITETPNNWNIKEGIYAITVDSVKTNSRFVLHFLRSSLFATSLFSIADGGLMNSLSMSSLKKIRVPLPPREVQDKIVDMLDAFTAVCDNLDEEIAQRKEQLREYRTRLLVSVNECPTVRLGEVALIKNGADWKTQSPGIIPVYGSGGLMEASVATPAHEGPAVLLPRKGSLEVQYVASPFWNIDTVFRTEIDPKQVNVRFFFHTCQNFDLSSISTSSTRPSLTQTALKGIEFPLPPLPVQQDIADKLDVMQALIDNLKLEREQRQQQFEFYRTQLLTFPAKDAVKGTDKDTADND